jgi:hypothetical protein
MEVRICSSGMIPNLDSDITVLFVSCIYDLLITSCCRWTFSYLINGTT